LIWKKQKNYFNSQQREAKVKIAIDLNFNIIISILTKGTINQEKKTNPENYYDLCIIKLNPNGVLIWTKQDNTINKKLNMYDQKIAIDIDGDIYVSFYYIEGNNYVSPYEQIALLKLNSDGALQWFKSDDDININSTSGDMYLNMTVSINKFIYLTYETYNKITGQTTDIVVAKFKSDGDKLWKKQESSFNTNLYYNVYPNICTDIYDNCYVIYYTFNDTKDQKQNVVIFKLNSDGEFKWKYTHQEWVGNITQMRDLDAFPSIKIDFKGNIYASFKISEKTFKIDKKKKKNDGTLLLEIKNNQYIDTLDRDESPIINLDFSGNIYLLYRTWGVIKNGDEMGTINLVLSKLSPSILKLF
jgi:hypothetical protein